MRNIVPSATALRRAKSQSRRSPKGLNPSPPQLASDGVEDDTAGESFLEIKHGIRWMGMPAREELLSDDQTWKLATFLSHMDKLPAAAQDVWQKVKN